MKYAINYYRECPILDAADEIIIQYKKKDAELIHFVQKYKESQRIIANAAMLDFETLSENLEIFNAAHEAHPAFTVLISIKNLSFSESLKNYEIPFFFIEGATCLDDVNDFIEAGVSDIYIQNELGFNIKQISYFCQEKNVQVRVYPNVAQNKDNIPTRNSLTDFFIRPEAVPLYEPFVDVMEFYGAIDRQPVLYRIYKDEKWLGDLSDLILELGVQIDNRTIVPYFDALRINCRKECTLGKCNACKSIEKMSNVLKEKKLGIKKPKNARSRISENDLSIQSIEAQTDINNLFK